MQDARNNFDAMRPAPICTDANQFMGQCQNVHISTNCYYGYHDPKSVENAHAHIVNDCEMLEAPQTNRAPSASPQSNARKRSADDVGYPLCKRLREGKSRLICLWKLIESMLLKKCSHTQQATFNEVP